MRVLSGHAQVRWDGGDQAEVSVEDLCQPDPKNLRPVCMECLTGFPVGLTKFAYMPSSFIRLFV